jgi:photosystem II stability/assembly factor-like uncharacterized protein
MKIAIAPSDVNVAYVSIQDAFGGGALLQDGALLGLFKTTNAWDAAPTWTQIDVSPTDDGTGRFGYCGFDKAFGIRSAACYYWHGITVDPRNPALIYTGGPQLWKHDGATWTEVSQHTTNPAGGIHADLHAFAWAGDRLIVGNDGGVWSTTDAGATWSDHNHGLAITQFYDGSLHPTNPSFAIAGSQDNGSERWSGTPDWTAFGGGDGTDNAISSSQPDTHWAFANQGLAVRRTTNAGATNIPAGRGLNLLGAPFVGRLEKCPANDDVFVSGGQFVYRTNQFFSAPDGAPPTQGPLWSFNGANLGTGNSVRAVAFFPGDTTCGTYAVGGFRGSLIITLTGGAPWFNEDFCNAVPNRPVTQLAFHPSDPNTLFAALSGFDEATPGQPGHLFKTTNALTDEDCPTWTSIGPPVNVPVNAFALDPADPDRIYVGTDVGVFLTTDGGATWRQFSPRSGLPHVAVFDVQINRTTNRVVAFTHGRGAFVHELKR